MFYKYLEDVENSHVCFYAFAPKFDTKCTEIVGGEGAMCEILAQCLDICVYVTVFLNWNRLE